MEGKTEMKEITEWVKLILGWINDNSFYVKILLSITIIFFQRKDTKSMWAWLLIVHINAYVGLFLYLVIGQDFHKKKMFRIKEVEDEINTVIRKQERTIVENEFTISDGRVKDYNDLVLYNLAISSAVYTENNDIKIYTDGDDKFEALINAMRNAKKYIHIQYYIISKGELFDSIFEVLEKKVKQGVEVRVLYDSFGSRKISKRNIRRMKKAGIKVGEFFPAFLGMFQFRFNYRNHRKIVVIDGKKAFVGGFNIGDEYIDKVKRFGHWRDTHFEITGEAVNELGIRFMLDWNYTTKENLFRTDKYFFNGFHERGKKLGLQIVSSGPDSKCQEIRDNYLRLINKAKKYVYIQTPYFIPDDAVLQALRIAALSGIDVKVMIPCKPDHPFVYWVTYSYVGELLESGAKCYCYEEGFLHAKGMIVDGIVSCYGTANMDMRSFALDFEVNAVIYDPEVSQELERIFIEDLEKCRQVTKYDYQRRSLVIRIKEQISRLLAPLV